MTIKSILFAGAASLAASFVGSPAALAGGCGVSSGCRTSCTTSCVKAVRTSARYGWRKTKVKVRSASYSSHYVPAEYVTRKERIMIRPRTVRYHYTPPVYGWKKTRVLVRHGRTVYHTKPAVYKTIKRRHVRTSCRVRTVKRRTCGGCVTSCKVRTPVRSVYYTKKRVKVRGARRYAVHKPAVYGWRKERVLIRSGRKYKEVSPAEYINRTVRVKVREARRYRVHTPAVYAWRKERVLLRPAKIRYVRTTYRSRPKLRRVSRGCSVRRSHRRSCR